MLIKKIKKQLTPERMKKETDSVRAVEFPPGLRAWMEKYKEIGERDDFVFRWCYKINTDWTLLKILSENRLLLIEVKTLFNMFIVLVDDISEKKGKKPLLNELLKVPFYEKYIDTKKLSLNDLRYLKFTMAVWRQIAKTIKTFNRYEAVKNIFEFDVDQFLNAVKYGYFITQDPNRANETEYWIYFPNSMQIIINSDLDLMCNNTFNFQEIGAFREVVLTAQKMARIGNWLTTWEREVKQSDFTSVLIPYALSNDIIAPGDLLAKNKKDLIKKIRISGAESHFLLEWEKLYKKLARFSEKIKSADPQRILNKFKFLIFMHLMSRGLK